MENETKEADKTENLNLLSLLNRFTSKEDNREWLKSPFNAGNRTIATNGDCLLSVPLQEGFIDRSERIKHIYPIGHTINIPISVAILKQKLSEFPFVDCFDEIKIECDACDGSGLVDFVFYHNGTEYELREECPVCDGLGIKTQSKIPNGKKLDYDKFFRIGNCIFNVARIEDLIYIADFLSADYVNIVNQTAENKPTLFKIKNVEFLVMPTLLFSDDENLIAQSIDIS
jgi:hypothetical protein